MNRKHYFLYAFLACAVIVSPSVVTGAVQESTILQASDGEAEDDFGYAVAVSGDWALVGARFEDNVAGTVEDCGAAYLFHADGTDWTQMQKLTASDAGEEDRFGRSVAIEGDYAVVGAPYNKDATGAAYVFYYNGSVWAQQAKLTASDAVTTDFFGWAVAISGDWIVVTAPNEDARGTNAGSMYVFKRSGTTWTQKAKLTASDGAAYDILGGAVSIDGNYIVVGVTNSDGSGSSSGSAYIYYYNGSTWSQQAKVVAFDAAENDWFGWSVSIDGDWLVVGAPGDDDLSFNAGSAYVYARSGATWTNTAKLNASDGGVGDSFGNAVAMHGDLMIIGASGEHAAYSFEWDGDDWVEGTKYVDAAGHDNDIYGFSVAVGSDYALIGAYGAQGPFDGAERVGAVYVYNRLSLAAAPIYRFWRQSLNRHFYTIGQSERDKLINDYSDVWTYENVAYYAFEGDNVPGTSPIYRFWSRRYNSHFYTMDEEERDKLINKYAFAWTYEGPAFYAYAEGQEPEGVSPVYRFWSAVNKTHFYTISETEKNKLITQFPDVYEFEGVAWYALAP